MFCFGSQIKKIDFSKKKNFSVAGIGNKNEQTVFFSTADKTLQMTLTPEQVKHALSFFYIAYEGYVKQGIIIAYPDIPVLKDENDR